jgi:uncharacterized protein YjbI with pentapeptide repeats
VDDDDPDAVYPNYKKSDFVFNFKGIEYFTNLKELEINLTAGVVAKTDKHYASVITGLDQLYTLKKLEKFKLLSADVKEIDLSKLPNLQKTELYLSGIRSIIINNRKLKKVRFIDESETGKSKTSNIFFGRKNKGIKELAISGNLKKITAPDMTALVSLENLYLYNIKMKKLDFSKNRKLANIEISHCSIKELDFSGNSRLTEADIENCSTETLDFSKNKELTWVSCDGEKTKNIILPKKNKISVFRWTRAGLTKFSNTRLNPKTLTTLTLFDNQIKSLNLKKYKNLEMVWVDKNVKVKLAEGLSEEDVLYR